MSSTKTCAFLTLEDPTGFFIYDELAVAPLAARGWSVTSIPWNRAGVDWDAFDVVVIRSPWDYQSDVAGFLGVLETIDRSSARLENPLSIVHWNLDKRYLQELEQKGVPIVPTRWLDGLEIGQIESICDAHGVAEAIAKPTIGANADDTFRVPIGDSGINTRQAVECFHDRPVLLQPFIPDVVDTGEHSLFYFGGEFSHCVLKTPKTGDFRVQEEHGGNIQTAVPAQDLLAVGQQVVDAIGTPLLYARVDLVRLPNGDPALMEVELIEPSLYFNYDDQSAVRFASALDSA